MVDVAFKVVGVGSVGTVCGIILLMSGKGDPLFLQFKQARQSVLEPYCGANPFEHAGQRVVMGQQAVPGGKRYVPGLGDRHGQVQKAILHSPAQRRQDQAGDRDDEAAQI